MSFLKSILSRKRLTGMSVKVEMEKDEAKGVVALSFECSRVEEHEILDAVRVAILGDQEKSGGYVHSNRFVVHIKEN